VACDRPLRTVKVATRFGSVSANPHITPTALLNARDTTLVYASRAPQADIARLKARMG
jgi:predicted dithiol-disulfide oxidoreductase (DUF899 family)